MLLALKMERVAKSQGMGTDSGSWKRQRNGFSPRASGRERSPHDTSILAQLDFQSAEDGVMLF